MKLISFELGLSITLFLTQLEPVLTLSSQDNVKLLEKLKLGFKRTIDWNKYQKKYQQKDKVNI